MTPSPQSAAAYLLFTEASRQQAAVWDAGLDGLRREMLARLEPAASLQADLQQLVTIEAGLQAQGAALAERVAQLEEQAARWGLVARRVLWQGFQVGGVAISSLASCPPPPNKAAAKNASMLRRFCAIATPNA